MSRHDDAMESIDRKLDALARVILPAAVVAALADKEPEPAPDPPEAPLGVQDVITLEGESPPRLTVLAVIGGYVVVTYGGYPPCVYRTKGWTHVSLAEIKAGDVVRDVEHGLCRVFRKHKGHYDVASTGDSVRHNIRQRHEIALVARNEIQESA